MSKDLAAITHVGFLTLQEYSAIAFSSAVEVLRMANHLKGQHVYEWTVLSPTGKPVAASNGLALADAKVPAKGPRPDIVFVCGGINVDRYVDDRVIAMLRKFARDGVKLGGLCTGTYALVRSGLMDGYECTIHWENIASLKETFRDVSFQEELFVVDRDRITCTGGIAPIDMMLALVKARFGRTLVAEISSQFILERVRDSDDRQYIPIAARLGSGRDTLSKVAELMEANFEEPLTAVEIARLSGLSLRQIQRLFHETLGTTPTRYYLRLRLQRARALLVQSGLSITEIAVACGFQSSGHFSKSYRSVYGRAPRSERQQPIVQDAAPLRSPTRRRPALSGA